MSIGIWVLGDQLNPDQSALASARPEDCRVLLLESSSVLEQRAYHAQKMVLVWSAMRHFAADLRDQGWTVDYIQTETFSSALLAWIQEQGIQELRLMEPVDRGFRRSIERLSLPIPIHWIQSNAFLWSREDFAAWAGRYKQLRMELFYREGRKRFGVLMEAADSPLGGQWNYDQENRKPPTKGLSGPAPLWFEPDAVTAAVIEKVEGLQERHGLPGVAQPFRWAVNRQQALQVLDHFISSRLSGFGPYQDAMVSGEPTLWHALLSPYLNLGLLHPLEVIQRLEREGLERQVPLAGLEGVIRQILGWREYTHGLYHWFGEQYAEVNHFGASEPLPPWFEQLGGSGMRCLDTVFAEIESSGYAHHIQRLMLLANYGLLAGLDPQALTAWFHRMFIDGFDWVMLTNVLGMGVFADGGRLASKPYAASGNYIKRMSNYCKGCSYDVKQRTGPKACPFNSLYWDFLARHEPELRRNHRMGLVMKQLSKLPQEELAAIRSTAANHRALAASGAA